jgi:VacB/RNase II family 3'-5' exoribonuclease
MTRTTKTAIICGYTITLKESHQVPDRPIDSPRAHLRALAVEAMRAHGLEPDFPLDAIAQVQSLARSPTTTEEPIRDLRGLLWCSIDNDESRDLDQLSVGQPLAGGAVRVLVAVADVDAAVPRQSPVDRHAAVNTTSVYTPAITFPMLPERLSTDLTSLVENADRLAIVVECTTAADGSVTGSDVYGATVRNRAKLAYPSVGAWLTGNGPLPPPAAAVSGMDAQLKVQDQVAQKLGLLRHEHGALEFETIDVRAEFDGDSVRALKGELPNRAKSLIENLMVVSNGVVARFLDAHGAPSIRRVVREPKRWDRIVTVAAQVGGKLPQAPDSRALSDFLAARKTADPDGFTDLSLTIIKLLGPGVYVVDRPGGNPPGHFGLAVKDYTHATAPNRRYPDLLAQRLLKGVLAGRPSPYTFDELDGLADHCTSQENQANKVERQVRKSAAALLVSSRIGARFDGIVTGASDKGTWVRVVSPPIEGKVVSGERGLDVGDHVQVQLAHVDVERGFIDFKR